MAGTMTWEEFLSYANELIKISDQLQDNWKLIGDISLPGQAYLIKKENINATVNEHNCALTEFEVNYDEDDSSAVNSNNIQTITGEFHIIYSLSYSVPVLYFNLWNTKNGSLLSLNDVWDRVAIPYKEAVNLNKWSTLTQQEHPILGKPFFQLHPCQTAQLISDLPNSKNPLLSWLSTVAPVAGLNVSNQYGFYQ